MTEIVRKMRCAVYTRKSTEEGLDMDYNSLDAQRDACVAYIASQKIEGWVPAGDIDAKVVDQVRRILQAPEIIAQAVGEVQKLAPETDEQQTIQTLLSIEAVWDELFPAEQSKITHLLVDKVTVSPTGIKIDMKTTGMKDLVRSVLNDAEWKKAA